MEGFQPWCRVAVLGPGGALLHVEVLAGPATPDLRLVDDIARLHLAARQAGARLVVDCCSPALWQLFELAGLAELVHAPDPPG